MVDHLKDYAENLYTDAEFSNRKIKYTHVQPVSKESLLYRDLFEGFYPGRAKLIPSFWLPNQEWL